MFPDLSLILSGAYKVALSRGLSYLTSKLQLARPQTLRRHYAELVASLSKMPFIYKDLTTLVLKDFAEIKFELLDANTLEKKNYEERIQLTMDERIRNRPKALFVGNAGIGKTTFFRYTALALVTSTSTTAQFFPDERLVPFYIPLKAVNNTKPFPILNYLLESNGYLAGSRGFRRLLNLARRKRLFLLLDGYDEIYFPPTTQANFLVEELSIIFVGKLPLNVRIDKRYRELYEHLKLCRAWLSSRREFYAIHPLGFAESSEIRRDTAVDWVALLVKGLHNRSLLVAKIFDIYRSRADSYREKLSEESFLQDIDITGDDDLIELSFNPLFLTVICYIHAQNLNPVTESHTDYRHATMSSLVLACIDLLLRDLDMDKVREVPPAQRELFGEVFKKRRSLYKDEKEAFLGYFSNLLLSRGLQVFDEDYISEAAKEFFRIEYREGFADEILRGLEAKRKSEHSFVRQLLNQGIFVLVPRTGETKLYDFPHRRFREVLAARYLNTPERVRQVAENIHNPQYAEFIYVFFAVSQYQNQILDLLLKKIDMSTEEGLNFGLLAVNCLKLRPRHYDATSVLMSWIREHLDSRVPFRIPRQVLDHLFPTRESVNWIGQRLRNAIEEGDGHTIAIAAPILFKASKPELMGIMIGSFGAAIKNPTWTSTYLYNLAEVAPEQIFSNIDVLKKNLELFGRLLAVHAVLDGEGNGDRFWNFISKYKLTFEQQVVLADVVQRVNSGVFSQFDKNEELSNSIELLAVIARHVRGLSARSLRGNKTEGNNESIYVVTRTVLRLLGGAGGEEESAIRKILRQFVGEVHADDNFLSEIKDSTLRRKLSDEARRPKALIDKVAKTLAKLSNNEAEIVIYFY